MRRCAKPRSNEKVRVTEKSKLFGAFTCVIWLICLPCIVRAPELLGFLKSDPALLYASLSSHLHPGPFSGYPPLPTADPNIGFTSQALGYRAAADVLSGVFPWWNHYEGVGAPLAGEMQAAALFPLAWLLVLPGGQLYMHICLQIIAGLSTFALLRKLGCTPLAACAAGIVFQFNGTYAWLANAVINPIAFLPVALLGIETIRERIEAGRRGGAAWLTVGLALSLYAGFPEVAYLDGLLILMWTLVRTFTLARELRVRFLFRVALGGTAALAIAAPILVAFADYLPWANVGGHGADGFAAVSLDPAFLLAVLVPYAFDRIFLVPDFNSFWGSVGGYAGCMLLIVALCGIGGRAMRGLRIALALWIAVAVGISYGMPGANIILHLVPGLKSAAYYRYLPPSWEFALAVLAGFGLTEIERGINGKRALAAAAVVIAAGGGLALLTHARHFPLHGTPLVGNLIYIAIAVAVVVACTLLPISARSKACGVACVMAFEAVLYFVVPTLSHPSRGQLELGGVRYLQSHIGFQRFVTLGPLGPNYGSYFGLASINHNDLPIPREWTDYVGRHLDGNAPPILFTGVSRADPNGPSAADNLVSNVDAYRKIGVEYVLVPSGALDQKPFASFAQYVESHRAAGVRQVYGDAAMQIFALSDSAPYFSAPGCALHARTRDALDADCAQAVPLTRLEMYMPGWTATVNGNPMPVRRVGEIFQAIDLPAGRSAVAFRFIPPHMTWAAALLVLGLLLFGFDLKVGRAGKGSAAT